MRRDEADAAHQPAADRADGEGFAGVGVCLWLGGRRWLAGVHGLTDLAGCEQLANTGEAFAAIALGEEPVVTDAMEAVGQDVKEKAADELVRGEPHDAASPVAAIVLVRERHLIVVDGDEPGIGDRRAMRVAGEIGQHALGPAEGRLGVDDERALAQARGPARRKRRGLRAAARSPKKPSSPRRKAASGRRGRGAGTSSTAHGRTSRKFGLQRDPALAVEGDAAAGNERNGHGGDG